MNSFFFFNFLFSFVFDYVFGLYWIEVFWVDLVMDCPGANIKLELVVRT